MKNKINNIFKYLFLLILLLPIIIIIYNSFLGFSFNWYFLLLVGLKNTLIVTILSIIVAIIIAIPSSIILGLFDIKYKKIFVWLFILTLIIPGYSLTILYSEYFQFLFSVYGLGIILGISSSPYLFLSVYGSLTNTSQKYLYTGQSLQLNILEIIRKILLPLLKPSILLGLLIVMAETIADFGSSYFLGINTLMVNIYTLFFNIYDNITGNQFSFILILLLLLIYLYITPFNLKKELFLNQNNNNNTIGDNKLSISNKNVKIGIYLYLIVISIIIFIGPLLIILYWSYKNILNNNNNNNILEYICPLGNTLLLIFLSIIIISILGYITLKLFNKNPFLLNIVNIVYSLPGIIIGIGILQITPFINTYIGSYIFLLLGLSIKLIPLVLNNLYIHYIKISSKLIDTWYSLGRNKLSYIYNIEIPLLKNGFISSSAFIFIEVMRELPIVLILKPFDFNTLSTKIFFYESAELIEKTAIPMLLMIIFTIIPIIYLYKNKIKI